MVGSALIFSSFSVPGAEAGDPKKDLQQLVSKIQGKIGEGKRTEKGLEPELKEFDGLLARYEKQKTDDVAQILLMKAILYLEVFEDPAKGAELIKKVKADFPETTPGKMADAVAWQKKAIGIVQYHFRKKLKKEFNARHEQLFNHPSNADLKTQITDLFKL